MTVTQFLPSSHPIASAAHAALVGMTFAAGSGAVVQSAHAQDQPGAESSKRNYRIPAGPLGPALSRFAAETDVLLSFDPALTEGRTTPGLSGDYSVAEAFAALLSASGLQAAHDRHENQHGEDGPRDHAEVQPDLAPGEEADVKRYLIHILEKVPGAKSCKAIVAKWTTPTRGSGGRDNRSHRRSTGVCYRFASIGRRSTGRGNDPHETIRPCH